MYILNKKNFLDTNSFYLLILGLFSFFIYFYFSKLGSFPIDTFLHYDSAFRILKGEYPIKDFWVITGLTVDLIQTFFFKIFGVTWISYTLHSSLFNVIISVYVYYFFLYLDIKKVKAFIISISFATLSYPISGTPFVDLHATFFLFIATLLIIKNLSTKKTYKWFLIIFLFFLSFFSKQVPVAYAAIVYSIILIGYFLKSENIAAILNIIFSIIVILIFIFILFSIYEIDLRSFFIQYLDYPRTIGQSRFSSIAIYGVLNKFKFLIIPLIFLLIINFKKIKNKKKNLFSEEIISLFLISMLTLILIFHQIMTKNQIYIYFLIPILFGFIEIEIIKSKMKFKKIFSILVIFTLILITFKYHVRYNENRKFHELTKNKLENTLKANNIHKSLSGLKWKNPFFTDETIKEVLILNQAQKKLNSFNGEIMLISNYLFLDSITSKKMNYPNRTFTVDGTIVPLPGNQYYKNYKSFLIQKIKENKIKNILFFKHENISQKLIFDYINENCFDKKSDDQIFYILKLKCFN